jgi:hypothetical protein
MGTSIIPTNSTYAHYYHNVVPNPHTHEITPNPHRHAMKFIESGSIDGRPRVFNDGCKLDCNILIKLIYDSLNTELAGSKTRVTAAAKKGNWITANKIGKPICDYLEDYYIYRVICYLRSRVWYTEYEALANIPTVLDIQSTGAMLTNTGGLQGTEQQNTPLQQPISHADVPLQIQHSDVPVRVDTPHTDVPHNDTPPPPQISYIYCRPPGASCGYYQVTDTVTDCSQLGAIPGSFEQC